jgi:hypothetical protein
VECDASVCPYQVRLYTSSFYTTVRAAGKARAVATKNDKKGAKARGADAVKRIANPVQNGQESEGTDKRKKKRKRRATQNVTEEEDENDEVAEQKQKKKQPRKSSKRAKQSATSRQPKDGQRTSKARKKTKAKSTSVSASCCFCAKVRCDNKRT